MSKQPLSETHPEIALQAVGWSPGDVTAGSGLRKDWQCQEGHIWSAAISSRTLSKSGCPYCSGRKAIVGVNDLQTLFPEIAKQASGWDPSGVSPRSHKKLLWKCSDGHEWLASCDSRTAHQSGCPYCSGRLAITGITDLKTLRPELASEADGWDPSSFTVSSGISVKWKCTLGHSWKATIASRSAGNGCPVCANRRVLPGFNDLATVNPELAKQADGWDPSQVAPSSASRKAWLCNLGHRWTATINSRSNNVGCPYCSNNLVLKGFNDFATKFPEIASEADGWDPSTVVWGSHSQKTWKCAEGHQWRAQVKSRAMGRGCPKCAKYGFDSSSAAWVYLLSRDDALQVGITNNLDQRVHDQHRRRGWTLLDSLGPIPGADARALELAILNALDDLGIGRGFDAFDEKFDGFTEAWLCDSVSAKSLGELLNALNLPSL
jgi:Probable Zinc-ribbon domain